MAILQSGLSSKVDVEVLVRSKYLAEASEETCKIYDYSTLAPMLDQSTKYHEFKITSGENPAV